MVWGNSEDEPHIVNALSFDLEDWFHIVGAETNDDCMSWSKLPSIFERYTRLILDDLEEFDVRATFFVVGWMAERYPEVIREVAERGHEVGSHSHLHQALFELEPAAFELDLKRSVDAIGAATGDAPRGFRAPSFSITPGCEWAFEMLLDAGFDYDASLFPAKRAHGGYPCEAGPHERRTPSGRRILEFPMSTMQVFSKNVAFSGGGYFRLFPSKVIVHGFSQSHWARRPVVVYLHPRDFAVGCPQPKLPLHRRIKGRVGQRTTRSKLRYLLKKYKFDTCWQVLNDWKARHTARNGQTDKPSSAPLEAI